ncbi:unnamed protein product [Lactuca saligna]|uniref:Uncharacterized protein n=1 Tax=Lactuca saligna TaxID=75948 RepID=A0AA36E7I7_LACSI|nr:unnamed protein product [Lactuca saligna]
MISLSFEPNELYQMACVAFCLIVASFSFFTIYLHSYLFILLSETRSHEEEKQSFYTQDIEGTELKVTAVSVHDMLGIPICGTKLTQLDQWSKDDTSYDEWKQQFKKDSIIQLSAIKNVIVSTTQVDFNFKLNFLVLFVYTFCESTSMGRCNLTKNSYIPYSDTSFFVGPSAFLVLFYADNIHSEALTVTHKRPTICYWSSEKIRYREAFEQEKGQFGLGEINEEFVDEQDEGDTDLEDNDYDKDKDHSIEAYE